MIPDGSESVREDSPAESRSLTVATCEGGGMIARRVFAIFLAFVLGITRSSGMPPSRFRRDQTRHGGKDSGQVIRRDLAGDDRDCEVRPRSTRCPGFSFANDERCCRKEPLAPEPFLVHGVQAQVAGDGATAHALSKPRNGVTRARFLPLTFLPNATSSPVT